MLLTVLVSLFAVTFCEDNVTLSVDINTSAAHRTSLVTEKNSASVKASTNTEPPPSTTLQTTNAITTKTGSSASLQPSPQTPKRTEETLPSVTPPPQTTTTNNTSNETVSHEATLPPASDSAKVPAASTANTTSQGLSPEWTNGDLEKNPGLVAILCIFCIVFILLLIVATVKCIQSPRSNFERLEDVPMSKVNEASPFAQYSK
ncbi:hypothetical protein PBY51_024406 [Eleginops maclovinus]|uniref:Uncharacterized protein n=2 Tax=Eleginops maclovinus TaxID=56733 RepID=A0AAN8AW24_ELEMC|nr:hypothetical protein PBY51_024406 [Eleginops maclovinus]